MWDVVDKMVLVRFPCQYAIWMFLHQPYKLAGRRKDRRIAVRTMSSGFAVQYAIAVNLHSA